MQHIISEAMTSSNTDIQQNTECTEPHFIPERQTSGDDDTEVWSVTNINDIPPENHRIVVIGCGNAGNTIINRLSKLGFSDGETIGVNADLENLNRTEADRHILIGKRLTKGLGAGGFPDVAREAALSGRTAIKTFLKGTDLCITIAGLGWGVGTGATPVITDIAREEGAATLTILCSPPDVIMRRQIRVGEGFSGIVNTTNTACVIDTNQINAFVPYLPLPHAYAVMDQLIAEFVIHLCAVTSPSSLVPVSFDALHDFLHTGRCATLYAGSMKNCTDADYITHECLRHPLFATDYREANQCLLIITGGEGLSEEHAETIAENFRNTKGRNTEFVWGAIQIENFGDEIHCNALVSGFDRKRFDTFYTD